MAPEPTETFKPNADPDPGPGPGPGPKLLLATILWAKTNHPDDYAHMMASAAVREATLVLWGQRMLYYDVFSSLPNWEPSADETR